MTYKTIYSIAQVPAFFSAGMMTLVIALILTLAGVYFYYRYIQKKGSIQTRELQKNNDSTD